MEFTDQSSTVRRGEELDSDVLREYLRDIVPEIRDGLAIEQFPGGYSNLTYLLRAGDRELVLRRPPRGANIASAHDMGREFRVISGLHKSFGRVPAPVHLCTDETIIGAPFYLMERLHGIILRAALPPGLSLEPATMRRLSESFAHTLAELHNLEPATAGLSELGRPDGYVGRQVAGWIGRYENAATGVIPEMDASARWLTEHQPAESGAGLIHNDFKYDNLVLSADDPGIIIGILDWEMATVGDPLMDLGMSLAYWNQADDPAPLRRFNLTHLPGNYTRTELAEAYFRLRKLPACNVLFYYRFGIYKLAVILQQIYARYHAGLTKDQRFSRFNELVQICAHKSLSEQLN